MAPNWILAAAVAACLASPAPPQKLLVGINDQGTPVTNTTSSPNILAFRHVVKQPMIIVACEFLCGTVKGTGSVHIFDHDAAANRPGKLLGSATFPMPSALRVWAGGVLDKAVMVTQPNTTLWLGWIMSKGGMTPTTGRSTTAPTYYWTPSLTAPIKWNGPYGPPAQTTGFDWMYRLYGPGGSGSYTTYGQGKSGTHGVPVLEAWGWPNEGNPITLAAAALKNQTTGILIWGKRVGIQSPLGNVLAFPPLAAQAFTTAGGKTNPEEWSLPLQVPPGPGLAGLPFAWQIWILDPGAAQGIAHTAGLEVLIG
jgi:hypothetical protein